MERQVLKKRFEDKYKSRYRDYGGIKIRTNGKDRQTDRQTDKQREREREREIGGERERDRDRDRQT